MDVQNLKEVVKALEVIGVAAKKVLSDGKVGIADLPVLMELMNQAQVIVKAVEGAGDIPAEVKDINEAEAMEVLGALVAAVRAVREA